MMKMSTVMSIGFFLSMIVVLAAAVLIILSRRGFEGEAIGGPLSYYLLLLGLAGFTGTAPVFALTKLGIGKALGIYHDEEAAE